MEVAVARQLGGGGRGAWAGRGEEATVVEAGRGRLGLVGNVAQRRPQGMGHDFGGPAAMRWSGVGGWARRRREKTTQ